VIAIVMGPIFTPMTPAVALTVVVVVAILVKAAMHHPVEPSRFSTQAAKTAPALMRPTVIAVATLAAIA